MKYIIELRSDEDKLIFRDWSSLNETAQKSLMKAHALEKLHCSNCGEGLNELELGRTECDVCANRTRCEKCGTIIPPVDKKLCLTCIHEIREDHLRADF